MLVSRQIDRKTDERADDVHFEGLKRIMRVQNISGQFTARKIDGAAKPEISAFKKPIGLPETPRSSGTV